MRFDFDPAKSDSNKQKHGIDFAEAQRVFDDVRLLSLRARDETEPRRLAIGMIGDLHWSVIYTLRGETIRIISARRARREERAGYEGR